MSDTVIETKAASPKADEWAERIAVQQRSGMSVKQFCKEQGLTEYSFYAWRKRLQESGPVRFALVEKSARAVRKAPLSLTPCDMRKSFDRLQALVRDHLELDAFAGHLFVFAAGARTG